VPKRAALAQALFREINERAEERVHLFGRDGIRVGIVCECADIDCQDRMVVPKTAYDEARAEPTLFIVKPGHIVADLEETILNGEGFDVVRKRGLAAEVARYLSALPVPGPASD